MSRTFKDPKQSKRNGKEYVSRRTPRYFLCVGRSAKRLTKRYERRQGVIEIRDEFDEHERNKRYEEFVQRVRAARIITTFRRTPLVER